MMIKLWIKSEFTIKIIDPIIVWIHNFVREFTKTIHYLCFFTRTQNWFTLWAYLPNLITLERRLFKSGPRVYYRFRESTIHYLFQEFHNCFVKSLWIDYKVTLFSRLTLDFFREEGIGYRFREDSLYWIFFANLWIQFFYRQIILNSLSVSRNHYKSIIFYRF